MTATAATAATTTTSRPWPGRQRASPEWRSTAVLLAGEAISVGDAGGARHRGVSVGSARALLRAVLRLAAVAPAR